ncbi:MAG: glycosyltransferase [Actinobacteria bacterium]|nr:glycosyltransferase [Actinomycetota bacterium]
MELTAAKKLVIWRATWLPPSETFIRNHVESLGEWEAACVGLERQESTISQESDVVLFSEKFRDRFARQFFVRTSWSPRLRRFLRDGSFRLVHAHFGIDAVQVSRMCRRLGLPLIVTLHGVDVTAAAGRNGIAGAIYRRRLRQTLRTAALVLAVSSSIAERALGLGAQPENTRVHYLGLPVIGQNEASANERRYDVLFVGRLVEKKGASDLLRAMAILSTCGMGPTCGIVGSGPLEGDLRRQSADQCPDKVDFLGLKSPDQVIALMRASRIVVVPSRTARNGDTEGLPMVILEAAVAGRTVVAYAHSGIPEVVVHGISGLLCPEGDVEELAKNIARLLSDDALRHEFEVNARARVVREFDIQKQSKILESLYDLVDQ